VLPEEDEEDEEEDEKDEDEEEDSLFGLAEEVRVEGSTPVSVQSCEIAFCISQSFCS
jgi:hypothetical protein